MVPSLSAVVERCLLALLAEPDFGAGMLEGIAALLYIGGDYI